jgi:hypothetical protein
MAMSLKEKEMTTVLELPDDELEELRKLTKKKDIAAALRMALREYIRYAKRMQLKKLAGKVTMRENWAELEKLELDSQYGRPGTH